MDPYEATNKAFARIQTLDKENASRIMGLLLIQDHGENEMIKLAYGPEPYLNSVISKAKVELKIPSSNNTSSLSSPSSPSPLISLSRQNSSSATISRLGIPNPNSNSSNFSNFQTPDELIIPNNNNFSSFNNNSLSSPAMNLSSPFYGSDSLDEFQLQDHHQLSFLNENTKSSNELFYGANNQDLVSSPNGNYGDWGGGENLNSLSHRRSCSVSDICLGSDDSVSGFGWKPCLYYARGFCKNGSSCRFLHGGGPADPNAVVGSPSKLEMMEQFEEMLRSKAAQQQQSQRLSSASFPYSASKCMNLLLQNQQNDTQRAAAALMMGEEMQKFNRSRFERSNFPMNGCGADVNPGSRQIYLTFPADSTFREEDVSNYFSIYGPVQDVRIPYQQKRMFGFVTFVYADTVKIILAKGNPHFVCDARVLVKPYKEKGKVPDKKQQVDRADYGLCNSPTGLDPRDPFDISLGPRMFYNNQDMLWRRKLEEQADLQQALELQSRRLMSLQLLDVKKQHHRALSAGGAPIGSPFQSPSFFNQSPFFHSDRSSSSESPPENCSSPGMAFSDQMLRHTVNLGTEKELARIEKHANGNGYGKESSNEDDTDLLEETLEHNLPDSPFASPTKAAGEYFSAFSNETSEGNFTTTTTNGGVSAATSVNNNIITSSLLPAASCYFPLPRYSSGHGAIGM